MTLKEFRNRYRLIDWIIDKNEIAIGDRVVWYDSDSQNEVFGYVVGMYWTQDHTIVVCRDSSEITESLNFMDTIVFKYSSIIKGVKKCSCGAQFTSNPRYHLYYCDFA